MAPFADRSLAIDKVAGIVRQDKIDYPVRWLSLLGAKKSEKVFQLVCPTERWGDVAGEKLCVTRAARSEKNKKIGAEKRKKGPHRKKIAKNLQKFLKISKIS